MSELPRPERGEHRRESNEKRQEVAFPRRGERNMPIFKRPECWRGIIQREWPGGSRGMDLTPESVWGHVGVLHISLTKGSGSGFKPKENRFSYG